LALLALLHVNGSAEPGLPPPALLPLSGWTVLERQARQAMRAGADRVVVLSERQWPELVQVQARLQAARLPVDLVRSTTDLRSHIESEDEVLLFAENMVIDDRLVRLMAGRASPALFVRPNDGDRRFELIDQQTRWGGLARASGRFIRETIVRYGDWDLVSTSVRAAVQAGASRVTGDGFDTYVSDRRRHVPLLLMPVSDPRDGAAATEALLAQAQKGCLDWPARFIHPPVENATVRLLLPTPLTPNLVTLITAVVGAGAVIALASGWLWTGLLLMLLLGPLDGVDGKLARTRLQFSRYGDLEHVVDKVVEYGAFLALGGYLAHRTGSYAPWALAALIIGFALAEAVQGEFFNRYTGTQLDDYGPLERKVRLLAGRRNTFFWTLIPFAVFGRWEMGLIVLAAYSVVTFFAAQLLFFRAMRRHADEKIPLVAANFASSRYAFLAKKNRSIR